MSVLAWEERKGDMARSTFWKIMARSGGKSWIAKVFCVVELSQKGRCVPREIGKGLTLPSPLETIDCERVIRNLRTLGKKNERKVG